MTSPDSYDDETIRRVVHLSPSVHVYQIPPMSSTKGHMAGGWTSPLSRHIFTARLRVLETSTSSTSTTPTTTTKNQSTATPQQQQQQQRITAEILLEDPSSGELFASAPYTSPATVEAAIDSARFFALRVVGEGGRKATLGIGFEERSDALDFNVALQDLRKVLGWEQKDNNGTPEKKSKKGVVEKEKERVKREWGKGIEEGGVVRVNIPALSGRDRSRDREKDEDRKLGTSGGGSGFGMIPPPPPPSSYSQLSGGDTSEGGAGAGASSMGLLPPPPSARELRAERRRSREIDPEQASSSSQVRMPADKGGGSGGGPAGSATAGGAVSENEASAITKSLQELGFDDGEFGEFQ